MTRLELHAVYESTKPAIKAYLKGAQDYKDRLINDSEFLALRAAKDAALKEYDEAEAKFIAESCK